MKLVTSGNTYSVPKNFLEKVAKAAFSFAEDMDGTIELRFISEAEMQKLNERYRDINKPTDVLSFNISEEPLEGQIVICYNIAKQQAKEAGRDLNSEVALLLVHGILHIFGYDHATAIEAVKMKNIEQIILSKEGIKR